MDAPTAQSTEVATAGAPTLSLIPFGAADVAVCDGDFCVVPENHTQAVVNRKVDEGLV